MFFRLPEIMIGIIVLITVVGFTSPLAFRLGYYQYGKNVQKVYRLFCHQMIDRSVLLFGKEKFAGFYSLDELRSKGVIPEKNPIYLRDEDARKYYRYPYFGNAEVGYKYPVCIRDLSMYLGMIFSVIPYLWYERRKQRLAEVSGERYEPSKLPGKLLLLLALPMIVDGVFQSVHEAWFHFSWVPYSYVTNIPKRIVTGALFGVGFGLFVYSELLKNIYISFANERDKGD